jgi:hypothetical protein
LNSSGTERPALTWLKDFVKKNPNPPNDFPDLLRLGNADVVKKGVSGEMKSINLQNTVRTKLICNPDQGGVIAVYGSNNQIEKFTLGGKKLREIRH